MFKSISVNQLDGLIGKVNIIDIRSYEKYNSSHIPTSVNIPYDTLLNSYSKDLSKEKTYYIYCTQGYSSVKLCTFLSKIGYSVINVLGGYNAWILR